MDRREAIGLGLLGATLLSQAATAQPVAMAADGYLPGDSREFVPLWPGVPPGGDGIALTLRFTETIEPDGFHVRSVSRIQTPGLFVYRPAKPNGLSILVIPGGSYVSEGMDRGGREVAQRFADAGITAFILRYRLPGEGWRNRSDVPLQDAQRAMRLIRATASRYGIDPNRLGVIGFSAGGHLAASLATRFGAAVYAPVDGMDSQSARPIVAGLMYPVVTMGAGAHAQSRNMLRAQGHAQALDQLPQEECLDDAAHGYLKPPTARPGSTRNRPRRRARPALPG